MMGVLVVVKKTGLPCRPFPSKGVRLNELRKSQCVFHRHNGKTIKNTFNSIIFKYLSVFYRCCIDTPSK